jgi:hypothetical protein
MLRSNIRRTCFLVLLFIGVMFVGSKSSTTYALPPWDYDPCTWSCPIPYVQYSTGSCTSRGCKLYNSYTYVCDYVRSGSGFTCPPLEQCEM